MARPGFLQGVQPTAPLATLLAGIPGVAALDGLPPGTPVWVRLDLDTPAEGEALAQDARVASTDETLALCRERGWRMLLLAHRGQGPDGTLIHVHRELERRQGIAGLFVRDWWSAERGDFTEQARSAAQDVSPGSFVVLENARRYAFEMGWGAHPHLPLAQRFAELASAYVMDAVATHNENFTTTVLPLAMKHVALGPFTHNELGTHAVRARNAGLLWLAGAKGNKLRHLPGILARGVVERVLVGGRLALALLAARTGTVAAGIDATMIADAREVVASAARHDIPLMLPIDHVLEDGRVVRTLPAGARALDVGPETREQHRTAALAWAERHTAPVVYANGVPGCFEDARFSAGTDAMVQTLCELQRHGTGVYVGGGEGREALERYASTTAVAHAFTAGGTLLRVLGDRPIPYLEALSARVAAGAPLA